MYIFGGHFSASPSSHPSPAPPSRELTSYFTENTEAVRLRPTQLPSPAFPTLLPPSLLSLRSSWPLLEHWSLKRLSWFLSSVPSFHDSYVNSGHQSLSHYCPVSLPPFPRLLPTVPSLFNPLHPNVSTIPPKPCSQHLYQPVLPEQGGPESSFTGPLSWSCSCFLGFKTCQLHTLLLVPSCL